MFERKTKEMYSQKIREISKDPSKCSTYGIHGPCALNELKFFHTSNNYSLDIMHDIYEGVVPYELCLILKIFMYEKKFFTLNFLNERILLFNYGKLEIKNRPGSIMMDSQKNGSLKIKQKAAKMSCLLRFIPFLIGDKIPEDDPHWNLFCLLSRIVDFVISKNLSLSNTFQLDTLVEEHHLVFKILFPLENLKKKHHNLIHYGNSIRQLGNLVEYNTIRFEGKHPFTKDAANTVHNTINICKSITKKVKFYTFYNLMFDLNLNLEYEILAQKDAYFDLFDPDLKEQIEKTLKLFKSDFEFESIYFDIKLKIFGQLYFKDVFVAVKVKDDFIFCKIKEIIKIKEYIYFFIQLTDLVYYDEHYCSFSVNLKNEYKIISKENFLHYKPFDQIRSLEKDDNRIFVKPYCFL